MKKNTIITTIVAIITSFVASTIYYVKTYNDKARSMGYTWNKKNKRFEKTVSGIEGIVGGSLDKFSMDLYMDTKMEQFCKNVFIISFVIGFIGGIVRRARNTK